MNKCFLQFRTRKGFVLGKITKGKRKRMLKGKISNNDEDRGRHAVSIAAGSDRGADLFKISRPENLRAELLPGIPNDVVLQAIAPKLSRRDIITLSLVSLSWREAIHRHWVYDARVRAHSTETFAVLCSKFLSKTYKIRLYSLHTSSVYDLPPISYLGKYLNNLTCIPLDGKIYILGESISPGQSCSGRWEMFVFDLVGHKQWKQCANMQAASRVLGVGLLDGKIYVVATRNLVECVHKCQVYDPKADSWYSIAELIPYRLVDAVAAIGGDLFFFGGLEFTSVDCLLAGFHSQYVVAYNPVKDEWRHLGYFKGDMEQNPWPWAFVAQGKFHMMNLDGIDVYDMDTNSWSNLHSFHHKGYNQTIDVWDVDDEIVILSYTGNPKDCLIQSRGFSKTNGTISFEAVGNLRLRDDLISLIGGDRDFNMGFMQV